jgi:hypothetical protein
MLERETGPEVEIKTIEWLPVKIEGWLPSGGGKLNFTENPDGTIDYGILIKPELDPETFLTLLGVQGQSIKTSEGNLEYINFVKNAIPAVFMAGTNGQKGEAGCLTLSNNEVELFTINNAGIIEFKVTSKTRYGIDMEKAPYSFEIGLHYIGPEAFKRPIMSGIIFNSKEVEELNAQAVSQIRRDPLDLSAFRQIANPFFYSGDVIIASN